MPPSCLWRRPLPTSTHARLAQPSRPYSASTHNKTPSRHALFYSDLVPGMIPVALLGSAIYLGLRLAQAHLSHDKFLDEARARVAALEEEIEALRTVQSSEANAGQTLVAEAKASKGWFW
ncbi:hypothetical protein FOMPIDRAFT_1047619 [Fomitopsis schrenkii]|uniref:Uncharacterized protein n=1 Tax=Fomitopsis schrenkii TaxID=2126942 RepID=S8EHY1_FOMSC|nr:hypothetical protein FOMPIDRAFT_1047619 [Fomitopsis schrenkii]